MHSKKTAFIVEHDFIMAAYLADRVIVYEGDPSKTAFARTPQTLMSGDLSCWSCLFVLPIYLRFWQTYFIESMPVLERLCTARWCSTDCFGCNRERAAWFNRNFDALRHEPVPQEPGHYIPARPHQLPPPHQQDALGQGPGAEKRWLVLLPGRLADVSAGGTACHSQRSACTCA